MNSKSTRRKRVAATVAGLLAAAPLAASAAPQELSLDTVSCFDHGVTGRTVEPPADWFSGDTHDHIQLCSEATNDLCDVKQAMQRGDLDVTSVLVWNPHGLPYTDFAKFITGTDVLRETGKVIRFGVETSGLNCGEWGHLIGLNIGPREAKIAHQERIWAVQGPRNPGLGLCSPDSTGWYSAPVAEHFAANPGAVRGYAHQAWATEIYDDEFGYDWRRRLIRPGLAPTDICIDPARKLAFPNLELLIEQDLTPFKFPVLAAMDVALGNVEFLEVADMDYDYSCCGEEPEARWYGMYYKLLNAGLRISLSGGTDPSCAPPRGQRLGRPRAWVQVEGNLTYEGWVQGLAAGRTTLAMGNQVFLHMSVDGEELGSEVVLPGGESTVDIEVTLTTARDAYEVLELVQNGEVVHEQILTPLAGETVTFALPQHVLTESSWLAARLQSNRAHTGATYVIVDGQPITSCLDAEYWMVWCDAIRSETLSRRGTADTLFACQDDEVLAFIRRARDAFKALADLDHHAGGIDPRSNASRLGTSSPAHRGPISIGITGPAVAGRPFGLNCLNAPASARGVLLISAAGRKGSRIRNVEVHVDPRQTLYADTRVQARRNGYAHTTVEGNFEAGTTLFAQFLWRAEDGSLCTSDALAIEVQAP